MVKGRGVGPAEAEGRQGFDAVVAERAKGGNRAEVKEERFVAFTAVVEVPKNKGKVVAAAWNFEGLPQEINKAGVFNFETSDVFPVKGTFTPTDKTGSRVTLKTSYTFAKPGTYFPTLRVAAQRQGDKKTSYTRIQNLDRVRVVVK